MNTWSFAPSESLPEQGAFLITGTTDKQRHHLDSSAMLDRVQGILFDAVETAGWRLQAWALFSNHYHLILTAEPDAKSLSSLLENFLETTTAVLNERDGNPRRQVWGEVLESRIAFLTGYYTRLKYVHQNAVFHRAVHVASEYPWCSAGWFETTAPLSFVERVERSNADLLDVPDEYKVLKVTPKNLGVPR